MSIPNVEAPRSAATGEALKEKQEMTTNSLPQAGDSGYRRHPLSAACGDMPKDEFDEMVNGIKTNGLISAIVTSADNDKLILDGWHRFRACVEAGVKPRFEPFTFVIEMAEEQAGRRMTEAEFVIECNAKRRHLTAEQKRNVTAELLKADPSQSDRSIAAKVKVSPTTVGTVRRELEATVQLGQSEVRTGKDGKARAKPAVRLEAPFPAAAVAREMVKRHGRTNLMVSMGKLEKLNADGVEVIAPPATTAPKRNTDPEDVKPAARKARDLLPAEDGKRVWAILEKGEKLTAMRKRIKRSFWVNYGDLSKVLAMFREIAADVDAIEAKAAS